MTRPQRTLSFQNDRMLEGVARQVMADIHQFFSKEKLERAAMLDERVRLARELHDGMLQSLTAAALQLQALSRVIEENPQGASKRLRDIEALIAEEQRELRSWVENLKPAPRAAMASNTELNTALDTLCRRLHWQWGVQVELVVNDRGMIPRTLGDEIYRLVQEGLSNLARHSHAQVGRVEVDIVSCRVRLLIADDGRGFPFRGRYDLQNLMATQRGPASVRERVASLRGELVLISTASGSRLEISLPLEQAPSRDIAASPRKA